MKKTKEYRFQGWETADAKPVNSEYRGIGSPGELYDFLSGIWCLETCPPRLQSRWTKENNTVGQCSITAFLAQDIFGGKVYGVLLPDGSYHCFNVTEHGTFDLTSEQFGGKTVPFEEGVEQFREIHFADEGKKARYELLKKRLKEKLAEERPKECLLNEAKINFVESIDKKKRNHELTKEEIRNFAEGAARGTVPDYQLAAMLMAIRINGMSARETTELTLSMRDSGDVLDLDLDDCITVDKHSTGGVGDGTSLVIAPLVAACGVHVPMVSGRGLGHTGGTLDKLESIPGFTTKLENADFIRQVREIGACIMGQTENVAPADKKLYALRDVTATVDSIPLVSASILSKKLASGTKALVLDVKTGSGAFFHDLEDSVKLARTLVEICEGAGVRATALVTDMNQPLGTYIGNALEVEYAIKVLKGQITGDYLDLCMELSAQMMLLAEVSKTREEALQQLKLKLESGEALEKFREIVRAQGGDPGVCDDLSLFPQAKVVKTAVIGKRGYVEKMDTEALGNAARLLGAGRLRAEDDVDPAVGYILPVRIGDRITEDTELCTVYAETQQEADAAIEAIRRAVFVAADPVEKPTLIYETIKGK